MKIYLKKQMMNLFDKNSQKINRTCTTIRMHTCARVPIKNTPKKYKLCGFPLMKLKQMVDYTHRIHMEHQIEVNHF